MDGENLSSDSDENENKNIKKTIKNQKKGAMD